MDARELYKIADQQGFVRWDVSGITEQLVIDYLGVILARGAGENSYIPAHEIRWKPGKTFKCVEVVKPKHKSKALSDFIHTEPVDLAQLVYAFFATKAISAEEPLVKAAVERGESHIRRNLREWPQKEGRAQTLRHKIDRDHRVIGWWWE